ncbi:MAG: GlsB/YeaQ/YmgE family stress response membrane protein [Devosia sp.]
MSVIGAIIIGLIVGFIAKLITPGDPKPRGFILTAVLGIVGALVAQFLGQAIGLYQPGEAAGFLGAIVGSVIVLLIWRQLARPQ